MNASGADSDVQLGRLLTMQCGNETRPGQPPVSIMVYMMLLMSLAAGNVVSNLLGAVMVARCLSKSFISGLLLVLSAAEVAFNAAQFAYQLMVWQFGYKQRPFTSLGQGRVIGYAFWAVLLLSLAFLMLRNWVIVLISCVRFERVYFPFGPVRYTTPRRLTGLLTGLLAVCLASSLPKTLRYNPVICLNTLTLTQVQTWLFASPTREVMLTLQSYFVSTLMPILLVVVLNALILRAVNRQRRLFNRRRGGSENAGGGSGGSRSALSRSKVTDRLLVMLMTSFVLCELPAFVSGLLHNWLPPQTSAHLIHIAHLATAMDSALNVLVYTMSQRQSSSKCIEVCVPSERRRLRQLPHPNSNAAAAVATPANDAAVSADASVKRANVDGNFEQADAASSIFAALVTNPPAADEGCRLPLLRMTSGGGGGGGGLRELNSSCRLQDQPVTQVTCDGVLESAF